MSIEIGRPNQPGVRPVEGGFGAWMDLDLSRPLSTVDKAAVARVYHQYLLVIFPGADLSMAQLAEFIAGFGTADSAVGRLATAVADYSGIRVVENVERGKFGPRSNSELHWHSDRFFDPVTAGILNSVVVPSSGGDTSFANMCRAYDTLPTDLRAAITGRTIKQDCIFGDDGRPRIRPGGVDIDAVSTSEGIETPITQRHKVTGRKFLYLGNRQNAYVPSLSIAGSAALLDRLYEHIEQPELQYRHRWSEHELVLYDNRACMHRREAFDIDAKRKLYAAVVDQSSIL